MKYKFNKKEKVYSTGLYPQARIARDKAKKQIKLRFDPTTEKKRSKLIQQAQAQNSRQRMA